MAGILKLPTGIPQQASALFPVKDSRQRVSKDLRNHYTISMYRDTVIILAHAFAAGAKTNMHKLQSPRERE